jgi:hypothetical protein
MENDGQCQATLRSGVRCTHRATITNVRNYCGTHHNAKMRTDAEYSQAYLALTADVERRERQRQAETVAAERQRAQARIEARRERNQQILNESEHFSTSRIIKYSSRVINLWHTESIPGYDCPKAYAALSYMSPRHAGFVNLIRAAVHIVNLSLHHEYAQFRLVPNAERTAAYTALHTALEAYEEINYMTLIPDTDQHRQMIVARQQREEEARRAAEVAAQRAAQRAEFERADRERPVVFQRDPDGGIDLRAFAADAQSVHRSSVQNTTQRIIQQLISRPVPDDQETVFEINLDFNNPDIIRWRNEAYKLTTMNMFTDEYFSLEAFSVKYGNVVDRVWAFIRGHAERAELTVRLAQEISEGTGMCANGKMARLVNVLQGYDETLDVEPPREAFQSAIAALMQIPLSERENRARELFIEYRIPAEEHDVWLEPLMDAEEDAERATVIVEA